MFQAEEDLLVIAAQSGNLKAFNFLIIKYQKPLLRFAYKLSNDHELANDAVQDSWIKLTNNLRQLKDPRAFKSWIYRRVKWRVTDLLRQKTRHRERIGEELKDSCELVNKSSTENDSELLVVINQLPPTEKQIIYLFYLDEMKLSEIAAILDIPIGTVKSRLNRARNLLRQIMVDNGVGVDPTPTPTVSLQ
ncbi:MAG: RNA polymerase subunit sigma-24 [Gammaproteobacteria bacterium]|nr:MAG: RNA polymerase subunit sigma-24 [Gammaproteobacteria bacterium]